MLDLTQYEELPPLDLTPPTRRKSPELALALSLLFPGLGHTYLGMHRSAGWIIATETFLLLLIFSGSGTLHAQAIFSAPVLYCFAIADAYFAAREQNAGVDGLLIGTNPRVTAVLNLLTKGFGYFYLGDRTKGIVCFIACSAVQGVLLLRTNVWTSILAISLQAAIAVDGYRIAHQRLLTSHPELASAAHSADDPVARANPGGLPPAIATVFFLIISALFLVGYSTLRAINGHSITTGSVLEQGPDGLLYRNPAQNLAINVPDDWTSTRTPDSLVTLRGPGMSVILLVKYSMSATDSVLEADRKAILKIHPAATIAYSNPFISNRTTQSLDSSYISDKGTAINQRIIYRRRGIKLIMLVETWIGSDRRPVMDQVEQSLKF
jgi:hypothetical protein